MAKEIWQNQNGVLKEIKLIHLNQSGVLKDVTEGWVNDNGALKQFYPPDQPASGMVLVISMGGFGNFTLPFNSADPVLPWNATIDWGDGSTTENVVTYNDPRLTHSYGGGDIWVITISGSANCVNFSGSLDAEKLIDVTAWGNTGWTSCEGAFQSAINCVFTAGSAANTSSVTSMERMFWQCRTGDPDVSGFDTSSVTTMNSMFKECWIGNPDVSGFVTTSVTNMAEMFNDCFVATPDVSGFVTTSVTTMASMFSDCEMSNPDVSGFNTSSVTAMNSMFNDCLVATPDVSGFDTSSVTTMNSMFNDCPVDPQISTWNIPLLTTASGMCTGSGLTTGNYDSILFNWSAQTVQLNVSAGFGNTQYTAPFKQYRDLLTNPTNAGIPGSNWIIGDGGQAP